MNTQSAKQEPINDRYATSLEANTVRLERRLPGPIERVWAYLTEPDKRAKWFAGGPMESGPAGKFTFHFHISQLAPISEPMPEKYKQYEGMKSNGQVTRCDPPHVLSFTWGEEPGDESEVTFELSDLQGEVLMVLTHRRLAN